MARGGFGRGGGWSVVLLVVVVVVGLVLVATTTTTRETSAMGGAGAHTAARMQAAAQARAAQAMAAQAARAGDQGSRAPPLTHEPQATSRIRLPQFCLGPPPFPKAEYMDFEMFGSAKVRKGMMELTDLVESQKGAIWSRRPLTSHNNGRNWQIDLRFQVGGSPNKDFWGDGFAFWVATERGQLGEALGGPDTYTGLAVYFDTFKNQNFQHKKHPYVYGKVSNGHDSVHYSTLTQDSAPGCHIPFRDHLTVTTTVARMTLLDGVFSVVMRPQGAVDWVQCFEIHGVTVVPGAFIGVSAMTGGLVDRHDFVQITTYGNVDMQPFSYALENKVTLIEDMWKAMRESGKVAREFEDWEEHDSFSDDLKWSVAPDVKSHLTDDYDDAYAEGSGEGDDADAKYSGDDTKGDPYKAYGEDFGEDGGEQDASGDDDAYSDGVEPKKGTSASATKRKAAAAAAAPSFENDPENAELLRDLNKVLEKHPVGIRLQKTHVENAAKMHEVHVQMRRAMQQATDDLHRAAREIRKKEHEISERIVALAESAKVSILDPFEKEALAESRGWFWPFVITVLLLGALAAYGHRLFRKYMKSHVL